LAKAWPTLETFKQHEFVGKILRRVTIGQTEAWIEIDRAKLVATVLGRRSDAFGPVNTDKPDILKLTGDFQVLRRGSELRVILPQRNSQFRGELVRSLAKAVARARAWYERIIAGEIATIGELADKSGLTNRYVWRILTCATLSPQVTEALLEGKHRPNLTLKEILRGVPLDWQKQENLILGRP
jgi:hypothetical protein